MNFSQTSATFPGFPGRIGMTVFVLISLLFITAFALTVEESEAEADAEKGRVSYRLHCQGCHGVNGLGDGPIAGLLKVRPSDLTDLTKKNDGEFPRETVYEIIDGREEVTGHGTRQMPVWGDAFQDSSGEDDQEAQVKEKISNLVAYLESIQVVEE